MKTYELKGGGTISGETSRDLVFQLNASSLFGGQTSLTRFMKQTSEACKLQTGAEIRFDTYDNFVGDLVANGFMSEVSDEQ